MLSPRYLSKGSLVRLGSLGSQEVLDERFELRILVQGPFQTCLGLVNVPLKSPHLRLIRPRPHVALLGSGTQFAEKPRGNAPGAYTDLTCFAGFCCHRGHAHPWWSPAPTDHMLDLRLACRMNTTYRTCPLSVKRIRFRGSAFRTWRVSAPLRAPKRTGAAAVQESLRNLDIRDGRTQQEGAPFGGAGDSPARVGEGCPCSQLIT